MSRKLKYHENRYRNFIYKNTTKASQYEQVAEEAVELAHVAQKIARILRGEQPVAEGVTFESEFEKFIEEYADVELAVFITETSTMLTNVPKSDTEKFLHVMIGGTVEEYPVVDTELDYWMDKCVNYMNSNGNIGG